MNTEHAGSLAEGTVGAVREGAGDLTYFTKLSSHLLNRLNSAAWAFFLSP